MTAYLSKLRQILLLRLLIFIFFILVVQNNLLGVGWADFLPFRAGFVYIFSAFLLAVSYFYYAWLNTGKHLLLFTRVQCAIDPVLIAILIISTGGLDSPFFFLFGVAILNTAFMLGQRQALLMAGMILICSVGLLTLIPYLKIVTFKPGLEELNRLVFQGIGFILTALLAGALAKRIGGIQHALNRHLDSLAHLTSLHYQIIHALPHALIYTNLKGIIQDTNPVTESMFNVATDKLIDSPLKTYFPALQWAIDMANGDSTYLEFKQKEQILGVNISTLSNQQKQNIGSLLLVRDLTSIKQMERKLVSGEKLSLTGQMAAGVAHEIRNPLAAILSAAQMFSEDKPRDKKLKNIVIEEVGRLKQLTTDFLVYSRPTTPIRDSVVLLDFVNALVHRIASDPRWGEQRELLCNIPEESRVLFDSNQLRQIFWNLLINAVQAAPDGGIITIDLLETPNKRQKIIMVEDDGPGLQSDLLPKLLEPFFTTRSNGTGLGLAVVAQLVRLNGGDIDLQKSDKGGLKVMLTVEADHG